MNSDKIKNEIRIFFYLTIEFVVLFDIIAVIIVLFVKFFND